MPRKLLFLLFTDVACTQNHALKYALDAARRGHEVKVIIEGRGTTCLQRLDADAPFAELLGRTQSAGLLVGACECATSSCGDDTGTSLAAAKRHGVTLLADLDGHAGIGHLIDEGYEVICF